MRWFQMSLAWLACTAMLCSPVAAEKPRVGLFSRGKGSAGKLLRKGDVRQEDLTTQLERVSTLDVSLGEGSSLVGELRNSDGKPIVDSVVLWRGNDVLQRVDADSRGRFRFEGVPAGAYRIVSAGAAVNCRVWPDALSPPGARKAVMLVADDAVRGQQPLACAFPFNPVLVAAVIAGAVGVAAAVRDDGDGVLADGS